jgi:hypothetical protein
MCGSHRETGKYTMNRMNRWIIFRVGESEVVCTGHDFDSHTERVMCWDAHNSEHVFELNRSLLVDSVAVKILWWNADNTLNSSPADRTLQTKPYTRKDYQP